MSGVELVIHTRIRMSYIGYMLAKLLAYFLLAVVYGFIRGGNPPEE